MTGGVVLEQRDVALLLDAHTVVMERIAAGAPLAVVLAQVATVLEQTMEGATCSILRFEQESGCLRHGAAPNLPDAYNEGIDGLAIGPSAGSCGTAAYLGEPVVAEDVRTDPRWAAFRDLAEEHGLRACWSSPIKGRRGLLGTFAVYHRHPFRPTTRDAAIVERVSHLAAISIEHGELFAEREARVRAEEERLAAERANATKSAFIATFSHELRTPLQAITGFTEALQRLDLTAERRQQALERIDVAATHILTLVNDTLDIARIEAGALRLQIGPCELTPLIDEVIGLLAPFASERNTALVRSGSAGATAGVDRLRLRQVLLNVAGNAVRYAGRAATVDVGVAMLVDGRCEIAVRDNGPGISDEMKSRLFVPFQRLESDRPGEVSLSDGGAGLGLVLARNLVELMGGTLGLESAVGKGTTVRIVLPAASATH